MSLNFDGGESVSLVADWLFANYRTQSYGAYYQFACFPVYSTGRVVGGEEGHHERCVSYLL